MLALAASLPSRSKLVWRRPMALEVQTRYEGPICNAADVEVTAERLEFLVARIEYTLFDKSTTVACALTLLSGFVVVGTASCLPTTVFDGKVGMEMARADAVNKLAEMVGFMVYDALNGFHISNCVQQGIDNLKETA